MSTRNPDGPNHGVESEGTGETNGGRLGSLDRSSDPENPHVRALARAISQAHGIVVLTGAGVSAESGIPTFRDEDGLWDQRRVDEFATPHAFRHDPCKVWNWYDERRQAILTCEPNPAHRSLAKLLVEREDVTLVTQNVDGLHDRAVSDAGSPLPHPRLLHLHGSLFTLRCSRCTWRTPHTLPIDSTSLGTLPRCPECAELARPGVVWFGEMLPSKALDRAFEAAAAAELCLVVGTSAVVHPAASIPSATVDSGGRLAEVNPSTTSLSSLANWVIRAPAGQILPHVIH